MRRIRIAAASVTVAAGLIGAVAAPAAAAPKTLKPAEALCAVQGRFFTPGSLGGPVIYRCEELDRVLTENQERTARVLCERAYRGTFQPEGGPTREYVCRTPT